MEAIYQFCKKTFATSFGCKKLRETTCPTHWRENFDCQCRSQAGADDLSLAMPPGAKSVPRHIAIIMDGNGRWAKAQGLPRIKGHEKGARAARECVEGCAELKVEYLTLYAFSAENWQRPK